MRIALQVENEQKAHLLVELLSSLDFIEQIDVEEAKNSDSITVPDAVNGVNNESHFLQPHINPNREAMLSEKRAYQGLKKELIENYLNQYVAIFQEKLVDHDIDQMVLIERLNQNFPEQTVLIEKVETRPEPILHYRSPRLVNE